MKFKAGDIIRAYSGVNDKEYITKVKNTLETQILTIQMVDYGF